MNRYPYTDMHEMNLDWILLKVKEMISEWDTTKDAWTELKNFVETYFENLDVQQEINLKLDEMAAGGELAELMQPYLETQLPIEVANQIADVVALQIGAIVAAQLPDVVADQLPSIAESAASSYVAAWLEDNVDPDTGYVIDKSLTTPLAAADAEAAGIRIEELATSGTWSWAFDNIGLDAHGNPSPSNFNLLSHPLYHVPAGSTVTIDAGFACTPVLYNSDDTFDRFGTKRTGPYTITIGSESYIRLYIVTDPAGGRIKPSDVTSKVHASWYLERYFEKNATEEDLTSEVTTLTAAIADKKWYPDTGMNAIFENWTIPKAYRHPGAIDRLYVGMVQMNDGKQGVLAYDVQTKNISRHVFDDFSTLDSHNAMAVSVMPGGHVLAVGIGHAQNSNVVCYVSTYPHDISEFNARTLIPLPTPVSGLNRGTYCQLFYLNDKYHLFTRMTYTPSDYSYYVDTWGHSEGTVSTDGEGNESITWSAFKEFVTASEHDLKYYVKGAYASGTKLKFFCQSNYSAGESDIRMCYLDVSDGSITDMAGNELGNENVSAVAYSDIPVEINKGTTKLHLYDVLDGEVNAIAYSRISASYENGQRSFFTIYEDGAWNEIELPDQGIPVYGSGTAGPGVAILDDQRIVMAFHGDNSWTIEEYERDADGFWFTMKLLDSYGSANLFQPAASSNIRKSVVCARGYAESYYDMNVSTAIIDL